MSDLLEDLRSYRVHAATDSSVRNMVWTMGKAADEIERLRAAMAAIGDNAASSQDDDAIWMDDKTPLGQFIDATLGTNNDDDNI